MTSAQPASSQHGRAKLKDHPLIIEGVAMSLMIDASPLRMVMVAVEGARQALEKADYKLSLAGDRVSAYTFDQLRSEQVDAYTTYARCTIELSQRLAELVRQAEAE